MFLILFISIYKKNKVLQGSKLPNNFKHSQAFIMGSSGHWKMLNLLIFILDTDGTTGCLMNNTWCQGVWHQTDEAGPHNYPRICARTFGERLKAHFRYLPQFMTMSRPQVTIPVWKISPLWVGNHTALPGLVDYSVI